jgi:hypothetical protein
VEVPFEKKAVIRGGQLLLECPDKFSGQVLIFPDVENKNMQAIEV